MRGTAGLARRGRVDRGPAGAAVGPRHAERRARDDAASSSGSTPRRRSCAATPRLADAAVPAVDAVWGSGWNQHPVARRPAHRRAARPRARAHGRVARGLRRGHDRRAQRRRHRDVRAPGLDEHPGHVRRCPSVGRAGRRAPRAHPRRDRRAGHARRTAVARGGLRRVRRLPRAAASRSATSCASSSCGAARGDAPEHLPTTAMFDGERRRPRLRERATSPAALVAEEYGQKALVRLYRLTVAGTGSRRARTSPPRCER